MSGPHTHPFRMVDRLLERGEDRCLVLKTVTADEVLQDGRGGPLRPWPSSLVVEAMAQAALPLAQALPSQAGAPASTDGPGGLIVSIDRLRIFRQVQPGERLRISAAVVARFGGMIRIAGRAASDGTIAGEALVAEGEFTVALDLAPGPGR